MISIFMTWTIVLHKSGRLEEMKVTQAFTQLSELDWYLLVVSAHSDVSTNSTDSPLEFFLGKTNLRKQHIVLSLNLELHSNNNTYNKKKGTLTAFSFYFQLSEWSKTNFLV